MTIIFDWPLTYGFVTDLNDLHNVVQLAVEAVQTSGDQQGGAAQTRRSSSGVEPIPLHPGHKPHRSHRHVMRLFSEVEAVRKPRYVHTRICRKNNALRSPRARNSTRARWFVFEKKQRSVVYVVSNAQKCLKKLLPYTFKRIWMLPHARMKATPITSAHALSTNWTHTEKKVFSCFVVKFIATLYDAQSRE